MKEFDDLMIANFRQSKQRFVEDGFEACLERKVVSWVIPPKQNSQFVAQMEQVLDVYKRPYDKDFPIVCMDESPKQMIKETKIPIPMKPGSDAKADFEYERCGARISLILPLQAEGE